VNWQEGQDPGTVNDSARSMMAAIAKIEDDRGGALTAGGSANALTVTTNQNLSAGQITAGMRLLVRATAANTSATVTFAPDGLTAANIKRVDGSALIAGDITPGMYLDLVYNTGSSEWRCLGVPHAGSYLPLTGGTLTGNLAIDLPSGTSRSVSGSAAGKARWVLELGNATAETGSNAGSDFAVSRYNDAGTQIGTPFAVARATGNIVITGGVGITGDLVQNGTQGSLSSTGGIARVTMPVAGANPALYLHDSTVDRSVFYYDSTNHRTTVADLVSGGLLYIDSSAQFVISGPQAYKPGGGSWAATSDIRIKDIVGEYEPGLAEVVQLRPVVYTYKGNDAVPGGTSDHANVAEAQTRFVGFIAQELEAVFPEMVFSKSGYIDGVAVPDLKTVDVSALVYALCNSIKELSARIAVLEGA
jgi:hypothetical protein